MPVSTIAIVMPEPVDFDQACEAPILPSAHCWARNGSFDAPAWGPTKVAATRAARSAMVLVRMRPSRVAA
jgi:hypothetical protein